MFAHPRRRPRPTRDGGPRDRRQAPQAQEEEARCTPAKRKPQPRRRRSARPPRPRRPPPRARSAGARSARSASPRSASASPRAARIPPRPGPRRRPRPARPRRSRPRRRRPTLPVINSPIAVYDGAVRRRPGRAPAVARRLRPAARPGRASSPSSGSSGAVLSLTRPTGAAPMDGPAPTRRRRRRSSPYDQLGPRPPLLARPHGPLAPPARRAARARLPRLVRDLQRRGRLQPLHARPDEPLPRPRARQLQGAWCARSRRTRR